MKMKSNSGYSFVKASMLALGLFLALPLFAVSTQAQTGWYGNSPVQDRNRNGVDDRDERRARRQQRREIRRDRRQDRRDDRRNDGYYGNNGTYRNDGYYGNNGGYRTNDNYGNYGGSHQLRQTALNAGYNNGMEEGREDRQRNERFNYTDESDYRSANKDYSSRLGDRYTYERYFREAFARGYRDGYNGVSGNNNGYWNY
jgi:hypothetical protein